MNSNCFNDHSNWSMSLLDIRGMSHTMASRMAI